MKFNELPTSGMWEDKQQTDLEAQIERDKIEEMMSKLRGYSYLNESNSSYLSGRAGE